MKKLLFALLILPLMVAVGHAQPALQLYSPDGVYDAVSDSWAISSSSFEIWVVASFEKGNGMRNELYDVQMVIALTGGEEIGDGVVNVFEEDKVTAVAKTGPYLNDTPPPTSFPEIGGHGIYPTDYWLVDVVASTEGLAATDDIYDYQDPIVATNSKGKNFKYWIETTYDHLHFDAYGYLDPIRQDNDAQDRTVAPFSHDAQFDVPEPATMLLMGLGLAGAGVIRRRKK
jgi:hypothetical protein